MSAAGNAVPSIWYDEAASIGAATRGWPALAGLLGHVDAVHGLYYAFLHLWFAVVPYSPFALRLPSALAIGGTVALSVRIAARFGGRRAALATGVIAALLPALTWAGGEGRSYALTALLATASTAALIAALDAERTDPPHRRRSWAVYALLTALGGILFIYLLLLLPAHAMTVVRMRRTLDRRAMRRFGAAALVALVASAPVLLLATRESSQVSWINPLSASTLVGVVVNQWFTADPLEAAVGWALLIGAGVAAVRRRLLARGVSDPGSPGLSIQTIALPWLLVPLALVLIASIPGGSYYLPRYLTFAAPAVALLLGSVAAQFRPRRAVATVALLSVLAVPTLVGSRLPNAKQHSSWQSVAALLEQGRAREVNDGTGDTVVYGRLSDHSTATASLVALAYPAAFAGLGDPTDIVPLTATAHLWEPRRTLTTTLLDDRGAAVVWLVTDDVRGDRPAYLAVLAEAGYSTTDTEHAGTMTLTRLTR